MGWARRGAHVRVSFDDRKDVRRRFSRRGCGSSPRARARGVVRASRSRARVHRFHVQCRLGAYRRGGARLVVSPRLGVALTHPRWFIPSLPLRASGDDDVAAAAAPPTSELEGIREVLAGVRAELTSTSSDPKRKKSALTFAVALVALVAIHLRDPGWGVWNNIRIAGSLLLGAGLALKGLRGGSLDVTGACGAALVGWGTLYAGVRFGVALGVFFASSAMTRVGAAVKARIDEHHVEGKEGGARN